MSNGRGETNGHVTDEKVPRLSTRRKSSFDFDDELRPNAFLLQALQIKSVIVKEGDRGYIYVEAFKSSHVKAACEDIRALNVQNLQMVPIKGMTDILRVVKSSYAIKRGSWVRVKKGMYRDDLAKVEQCDMAQNLVTLKLIPRIDYSKKRGFGRSNQKDQHDGLPDANQNLRKKNRFAFKRPPAKLFDATAIE